MIPVARIGKFVKKDGIPIMNVRTITIYDIAKEAGVSPATVSRVLTNNAKVSAEKREKVEKLIEKYDFKPNALARGLSDTKTKTIGVIAADIRNPFYASLFVECEKAANAKGYTLLLCNSLGENALEDNHLEKLYEKRVDAIIQIGGRVDELVSDNDYVEHVNSITNAIPMVITGKLEGSECFQVSIDEQQAMQILLEYLIQIGHRNIALVGGRNDVKSTYDKRLKYKQILNKYAIEYQEDLILEGANYDDESGYVSMNQLFERKKVPTAIIAINDFTAMGIIRAIMERGLTIPNDLSVASFDNTFMSQISMPRLTTVGYDYQLFGERLVNAAIEAINGEEPARIELIKSELIIRDSCKKLI